MKAIDDHYFAENVVTLPVISSEKAHTNKQCVRPQSKLANEYWIGVLRFQF